MPDIYAGVLTGGKSRRFGQDKATLKFGNITLLERIYGELNSVVTTSWIIGRKFKDLTIHPKFFIEDIIADIGPIGGLFTVLNQSKKPTMLLSCDMPFIKKEHIIFLIKHFDPHFAATIAVSEKGIEPLFGIYQHRILPVIEQMIASKDYAMFHIFDHVKVKYVDFAKTGYISDLFFNINTLRDYKKALFLRKAMETNGIKA